MAAEGGRPTLRLLDRVIAHHAAAAAVALFAAVATQAALELLLALGLGAVIDRDITGPVGALLRQPDLALDGIDAENLDVDFVAHLDLVLRVLDLVVGQLADVQQAFEIRFELDEHAEVRDLGDLAADDHARLVAFGDGAVPGIFGHLLESERDAHLLLIDLQDDAADAIALLKELAGMADLLGPAH